MSIGSPPSNTQATTNSSGTSIRLGPPPQDSTSQVPRTLSGTDPVGRPSVGNSTSTGAGNGTTGVSGQTPSGPTRSIQEPPRSSYTYQPPTNSQPNLYPGSESRTGGQSRSLNNGNSPISGDPVTGTNPYSGQSNRSSRTPSSTGDYSQGSTGNYAQGNEAAAVRVADLGGMQAAPPTSLSPSATEIVKRGLFSIPYDEDGLEGRPVRLIEVLPDNPDPQSRLAVIQAYWNLTVAVADHHFATEEMRWLKSLQTPRSTLEASRLSAMSDAAEARYHETKVAVLNYQYAVSRASNRLASNELVLPLDAPFIGRYQTHYEEYAKSRTLPAGLQKIDRALPLVLDLIAARAQSTESGLAMFLESSRAYQAGTADVSATMDALVQSRDQRLALLAAVRDYNQMIAEYALAVGPSSASRASVVAMLIEVDDEELTQAEARRDSQVIQASANSRPTYNSGRAVQQRSANQGWNSATPRFQR